MTDNIDQYSHRLSLKNDIAYESARNVMEDSINRLKQKNVETDDLERSAYKYSRVKLRNQDGGKYKTKKNIYKINYNKN